ncbi:nickel-responsive transcriptional regulator NikR [Bacillaceae bacterium]
MKKVIDIVTSVVMELKENEIVRFGISMPRDLMEQFDQMIIEQGYDNRSEAIRDLVRKALIDQERISPADLVAGTIAVVYDHQVTDLANSLLALQHEYHHEIISTLHVHLNRRQCLEILIVRGVYMRLKQLQQRIQVQKGVFYAGLSVTHVDQHQADHVDKKCHV